MTPGELIIDEIIRQSMVRTEEPAVLVWSANAAEQLDAIVAGETKDIMRKWGSDRRVMFGAFQLLKESGNMPGSEELIAAYERATQDLKQY